jgi:hypothetical protein
MRLVICIGWFLFGLLAPTLAQAQAPAQAQADYSCMETAEHRQFDFWAGEWVVKSEDGSKRYGNNTITITDRGCALKENWRSAMGGSGSSINFFNPKDKMWHQIWMDSGGSVIRIAGNMRDGSMTLAGEIYYPTEQRSAPFRGQWTHKIDGRVRQFFEEQDAAGEWQVWFDGYYNRVD